MSACADRGREIAAVPQAEVPPASRSERIRGWENAMSACADRGRKIAAFPQVRVPPKSRGE
jgi:hypothetical protein